jgi:hypothetical protein
MYDSQFVIVGAAARNEHHEVVEIAAWTLQKYPSVTSDRRVTFAKTGWKIEDRSS